MTENGISERSLRGSAGSTIYCVAIMWSGESGDQQALANGNHIGLRKMNWVVIGIILLAIAAERDARVVATHVDGGASVQVMKG